MGITALLFALHLACVANVPLDHGLQIFAAVDTFEARYDLAATLVSEHSSGRWDFSLQGAIVRAAQGKRAITYEADAEGKGGERGLYQLWPGWAGEFGYKKADLWEPETNIIVAAAAIDYMQTSHASCNGSDHAWVGHYKCKDEARDSVYGRCLWAQNKWLRLRASLVSLGTPADYLKAQRKTQAKREQNYMERYYGELSDGFGDEPGD